VAGLTVGAMLVPQGMAYAELAGLPPSAGFAAVLLPLVVYALLGSSRHLGVGPEPGTALLAATGVGLVAGGDPARYVVLMVALTWLVAVVCVVGWVLRLGFVAELLSKPVLVGYISGVGLSLLASQLGKATGVKLVSDGFFPRLWEIGGRLREVHATTALASGATLALLLALRRWAPKLPGALIGVVTATSASMAIDLPALGVRTIAAFPAELPTLAWPAFSYRDAVTLLPAAVGIALVGYTDNVLTARAFAAKHGYRVYPNQELLALGAINLASAASGGFPISSGASRTAVPSSLGSHSQVVGLVAGASLVAALLGGAEVLANIPEPALAAVILSAAIAIVDVTGFRRLYRISKAELAVAAFGALSVMVFDVLTGVLCAVTASVLLAFGRMALPHDAILAHARDLDGWVDADEHGLDPTEGLLVYRFDAPLFFANATRFRERLASMAEKNPGREEWIVLDFEGVGEVDATALEMLEELTTDLVQRGIVVAVARANAAVTERLELASLSAPGGALRLFPTINGAVRAFAVRHDTQPEPEGPAGAA
jgi:high affinity sulfate transporter 1